MRKIFLLAAITVFCLSIDAFAQVNNDQLRGMSFEQREEFTRGLQERIDALQNQLNELRNANSDNWDSIRNRTVDVLEGSGTATQGQTPGAAQGGQGTINPAQEPTTGTPGSTGVPGQVDPVPGGDAGENPAAVDTP